MISVQFTWIGNDWLGMERHWLPFKASHKSLSPQTPRILQLQFSFHILSAQTPKILLLQFSCHITHKNYSRADELVSAILLVIFDPIAITPAVVHGIYQDLFPIYSTQDMFEFSAVSTPLCHRPGCLDSHKAFFFLEQNRNLIATRNAWRQWKSLCKISFQMGLHLVQLVMKIEFLLFKLNKERERFCLNENSIIIF